MSVHPYVRTPVRLSVRPTVRLSVRPPVALIPPTSGALLQHDNRTLYQGGQVWGNSHVKELNLVDPPPGWIKDQNGKYTPFWTLDTVASEACKQLVKCKCKSKDGAFSCKGKCSCRKIDEDCTELCECKGKCKWT